MHHGRSLRPKAKEALLALPIAGFAPNVGKQVIKRSGKPFKSGDKIGTVRGIVIHSVTGRPAYTFAEDDSTVECWRCILTTEGVCDGI